MREILFRGKRKDNGEWVQGDLLQDKDLEKCYIEYFDYYSSEDGPQRDYCQYEVIPETVGQYTGLTDKNRKKIFEGDILESRYDEEYPDDVCFEVVLWYDNGWCIQEDNADPDHLSEDDMLEYSVVIGNIYDNPELVKGGAE